MVAHWLVEAHQDVPGRKARQLPQLSLVKQQEGIWTQARRCWHHEKPAWQTQFPQLSLRVGQLGLTGKQPGRAAHQVNPGFRVRQVPQLS